MMTKEEQELFDETRRSIHRGDILHAEYQLKKLVDLLDSRASALPSSIQEALNSGDGTYRP